MEVANIETLFLLHRDVSSKNVKIAVNQAGGLSIGYLITAYLPSWNFTNKTSNFVSLRLGFFFFFFDS